MRRYRVGTVEFKCRMIGRYAVYWIAIMDRKFGDGSITSRYFDTEDGAWADCEAFMTAMGAVRIE